MIRRAATVLLLIVLPALSFQEPGAREPGQESDSKYEFFSGSVTAVEDGKFTVSRSLPGRGDQVHTFLITGDTVVEGKLQPRARVTVGYMQSEEGDVAVRVIVRKKTARK